MRILIVTCNRSIVGGIEKYLQVLIPALVKRGNEVGVLYEHPAGTDGATVDPPEAGLPLWYWENSGGTSAVCRELAAWRPDVVYAHGLESLAVENVLLDSYPTVWYAHVYLGTCTTGRKCHAFPQVQPCTRRFGPACLALHYPRRCGGLNPWRAWRAYQVQSQRHSRLPDYRAILVASRQMYREYENHGVGPERLRLVPLPLTDTVLQNLAYTERVPGGKLLFVGRLTDLKGVNKLIEAIPKASEKLGRRLTLTVAGEGPERPRLEALAGRLLVPADFVGWADTQRKMELMRGADLLAVPSLWPEPFGLVGAEAGCLGLPAAGFAVGGIPDWLVPGQTGELAPGDPPSAEGLADAIVRALADPGHYSRLSRGAWERSRQFTMERHLAELEPVLHGAGASPAPHAEAVVHLTI